MLVLSIVTSITPQLSYFAWHLTKLGFFGHLGLMDNVAQDLLFLQQLVFVQCLLLAKVVVMLLLVLLQLIQCPLQRSTHAGKGERENTDDRHA